MEEDTITVEVLGLSAGLAAGNLSIHSTVMVEPKVSYTDKDREEVRAMPRGMDKAGFMGLPPHRELLI